jgi:uncharacterized membrane protein
VTGHQSGGLVMTYYDPNVPRPPAVSDPTIAMVVYGLYLSGYFFLITPIAGVIVAYIQHDSADPVLQSHYRFQIRTFWISALYFVSGVVLCLVIIGLFILLWWFIWSLVRCIKGILALNEGRPIDNPTSWMFG